VSAFSGFQSYEISAYALFVVNDIEVEADITSCSFNYTVGKVPDGQISFALGRDIYDEQAAAVHAAVNQLGATVPVQVFLRVTPGDNSVGFDFEQWPEDYFLIFDGLVTHTGYTRTRTEVSFTLGVQNWLSQLEFSSVLTKSTASLTSGQWSAYCSYVFGPDAPASFQSMGLGYSFFNPLSLTTDFWGDGLGPWLSALAVQEILTDPEDLTPPSNVEALAALNRFEPFAAIDELGEAAYQWGIPLQFPFDGSPSATVLASAFYEDIASRTFDAFIHTTFFQLLVDLAGDYRFQIVPLINTALIVPTSNGIRVPWQTIYGEEYESIRLTGTPERPLRGVRLMVGSGSLTGTFGLQKGQVGTETYFAGIYSNPNFPVGMLLFESAPRWAANAVNAVALALDAANPVAVKSNAQFPGAGDPPNAPPPQAVRAVAAPFWDTYAQSIYTQEVLRWRTGSIRGKLRFDIAPGSVVQIDCVEDPFVEKQFPESDNTLYGEVMRVTIKLDSDGDTPKASTTFWMRNIRSSLENQLEGTSTDQNPLYLLPWNGAPLCEDPIFAPVIPNPVFGNQPAPGQGD
jgi:hypothetical protein